LSNGSPKCDTIVGQVQKNANGILEDQIDDGGKDGNAPASERAALGTLYSDIRWVVGFVRKKMYTPTPASKSRSKISLMVQAEPRTRIEAIKNLNISVQKVCKSKLVWYAAMVRPQADFARQLRNVTKQDWNLPNGQNMRIVPVG
jgi:hypothetical protein